MARKGKWDDIIKNKNMPRDFGEEPAYQDKINLKKDELRLDPDFRMESPWLGQEFVALRREKNRIAKEMYDCELRLKAVGQLMADQFEKDGIKSLRTADGCSVGVTSEPNAKVVDREALRLWAIKEGLESQMSLPWGTVNGLLKARLAEGEPEMPGVESTSRVKFRVEGLKETGGGE